jgi:exodeoxyribonuclease V alpha subunit
MPATVAGQGGGAVLDGVLERVTFANPETGYTIARIAPERSGAELVTAVGALLGAQVGEFLRLRGRWSSHPRYGRQFEVHSYATVLPATAAGIQKYLGSGLIKGIGPVMAERMVAHFGVDIMHVIGAEPGRLAEVDGLGPKRTAMIAAAWAEQQAIKEVMIFLQGVGVSTSLAVRIYKKYGDASVSVVRDEPYRLAADVWGIGFKTADTIAASVGIARDSPQRIKAGLAYTLSEAADDGHCYLPAPNLAGDAAKILEVPAELIIPCLDELAAAEGWSARRCPPRRPPHRRSPPSTCRPSIRPNGPWRTPCSACLPRRLTGWPGSPEPIGTRRWPGCPGGPAPSSRPSRPRRRGWP